MLELSFQTAQHLPDDLPGADELVFDLPPDLLHDGSRAQHLGLGVEDRCMLFIQNGLDTLCRVAEILEDFAARVFYAGVFIVNGIRGDAMMLELTV